MRVLAHIHSFNDADIIEGTIQAVRSQTRVPDSILLVDNGSTDGTLDRVFPQDVTVSRNRENLGTSGAVWIGINYGLEHGFDWVWILDADSVPDPDALERMLQEFAGWPERQQSKTGFIACLPCDQPHGAPRHGRVFTEHGRSLLNPPAEPRCYPCHVTIWSGILYRLEAVREIGLPNRDYVLDRGELEYAYRVMKAGYQGYIHQDAIIRHNIRGTPIPKGLTKGSREVKLGPFKLVLYESQPIRCYYICRNSLYFSLYDQSEGAGTKIRELFRVRSRPGRGWMSGIVWQTAMFTLNFLIRPLGRGPQIKACFRGIWDGITGNMAARY